MTKPFHLLVGTLSLILGFIGIFLPLLPTTPFVLVSAYCFSRSSPQLHAWLLSSKLFGDIIRNWEQYGAIGIKAKKLATLMMLVLISYPVFFTPLALGIKAAALVTCAGVLTFIWTRPSAPPKCPQTGSHASDNTSFNNYR